MGANERTSERAGTALSLCFSRTSRKSARDAAPLREEAGERLCKYERPFAWITEKRAPCQGLEANLTMARKKNYANVIESPHEHDSLQRY